MEAQVRDALRADGFVDASEIGVEVDVESGELTLTGRVPSRDQRRLAQRCAASVQGIGVVHNRLTIDRQMESSGPGGRELGKDTTTAKRPVQTLGVEPEKKPDDE
jgi:hypothetical protein